MAPLCFTCGVPWGGNVSSRVKCLYVREHVYRHCLSLVPFGEAPGMAERREQWGVGKLLLGHFLSCQKLQRESESRSLQGKQILGACVPDQAWGLRCQHSALTWRQSLALRGSSHAAQREGLAHWMGPWAVSTTS